MHKIALELGPLTLHWYGVLVAAGFLAGLWTASRRALRAGMAPETVLDLGPWVIVGAVLGARLLYVLSYWNEYFARQPLWEVLMIHHGGLVYYGGLGGASLTVAIYARVKGLWLWRLADLLAPSIALGQAFGRVGCLMNGCCYGKASAAPWAIRYPETHETLGAPVHPAPVYEGVVALGLYLGLAWWWRRRQFEGQVFALYLIGYSLLRGLVESFRGDYAVRYLGGWATPAQVVSILILAAGVALYSSRAATCSGHGPSQ